MAAGGTYSGTVTVPTQKGTAYGVNFDGVFIPAVLTAPEDGFTNECDYQHKGEVRDIAGNIMNKLYGGSFQRSKGTLKVPQGAANATRIAIQALRAGSTLSMNQVVTAGTFGAAENWMVEEDPIFTYNREYMMVDLTLIKEPGITPA
jgi:hypothetical protein